MVAIHGEHQYLTSGDGHETRTPMRSDQPIASRPYLDAIQCSRQTRKSNPEQQAGDCKDQHQFYEGKALSHGPE
jgi:hypothetical protein